MVFSRWCPNPSTERQSSAYPSAQRQSLAGLLWCSHSASFLPSSFMVAPWLLIALLLQMGLGRTAAIWGFWKATPLAKAVTVSPRMTLVVSKFKLLTEAVTTNTYCLSSSIQSGGTMGLVNSTTNVAAEAGWGAASIRLASLPVNWFSILGLVERTVVPALSGGGSNKEGVVPCVSQTPAEFDSALPMPVMVGWGHWFVVPGSILPKPQMTSCLEKTTCSFTLPISSRMLLTKGQKSRLAGGLNFSSQYCNPWA